MRYPRALTRRASEDFFLDAEFLERAFFETALSRVAATSGKSFLAASASLLSRAVSSFFIAVLYLETFARLRKRCFSF